MFTFEGSSHKTKQSRVRCTFSIVMVKSREIKRSVMTVEAGSFAASK